MYDELLKSTSLYREARNRYSELIEKKKQLDKRAEKYPKGKLHIVKKTGKIQYYIRDDKKDRSGKYLSKKETAKIKAYLQKKYDEKVYPLLLREIDALRYLLAKAPSTDAIQKLYSDNPQEIKLSINPLDISDEDYASKWLSIPYIKKTINEEAPDYYTENGERVRSKSELNIANFLYKMKIPYKYECPLLLANGIRIYPDFTILDISRRCEVYWEHRGMMDETDYANHSVSRLKQYEKSGIYIGDRLIITEETSSIPLGTREIEEIIAHFFITRN